jgi:hypothetical protein
MQSSVQAASASLPVSGEGSNPPQEARNPADLAYEALTLAAILLLLGSLWVF